MEGERCDRAISIVGCYPIGNRPVDNEEIAGKEEAEEGGDETSLSSVCMLLTVDIL